MIYRLLFLAAALVPFVTSIAQVQTVSSTRIDELKLNMPLDSVNKLLANKIYVKESKDFFTDTFWVNYKSDSVQ